MKLFFLPKNYFFDRHSIVELTGSVPSVPIPKEIIMRIPTATSIVWVSIYIYVLIHYKFTSTQNVLIFCPARSLMHYPPYLIPHSALLSHAKDTNTFSLCVFVQRVSPSRQCNYTLPSHPTLLFPFRAQRASATRYYWHILCVQKKKNWTGGRLRLSTERKFSFHILSSCLSSWSQRW